MSSKKSFLIRIDPQLYEALAVWSADEFRSVNAHLEYLLQEAVRKAGRWKGGGGRTRDDNKEGQKNQ